MSLYITKYEEVEVEIDLEEEIKALGEKDKQKLIAKLYGANEDEPHAVPFGFGDGDMALVNNTIERAYLAAKQLNGLPREIADLFWIVHRRAL